MNEFRPCIIEQGKGGEWTLNAAGRELARDLAKGGHPLAARQSALLWKEVERLRQARATAKKGKAGKEAKQ